MNGKVLKYSLLALSGYFICMAIAHFFSLKYPLLFVYYDTPFYAYQDKIISFSVISYAALFYLAAKNRFIVPTALTVLAITILGLASVNMSSALQMVLEEGQSTAPYWIQTILFAIIFVFLTFSYKKNI